MDGGKRTHRRDRVARRFLFFVLFVGVLVFFAPAIVGGLGLHNSLLGGAVPASVGKLTAGGVRLGWWSPVELTNVQLTDPQGAVVFRAASVRVDRTLMQLAGDANDLGVVRVDRPMFAVFVRPDGSSLEDLIAALDSETNAGANNTPGSSSASPPLQIEVTGGALQIVEAAGEQRSWVVDEVNASIDTSTALPTVAANAIVYTGTLDTASAPLRTAGQVAPPRNAGSIRIENASDPQSHRLALDLQRAPLDVLQPWLARFDPTLRLIGEASGAGTAEWRPAAPQGIANRAAAIITSGLVTSGSIALDGFELASERLCQRPVKLTTAKAPWRIRATADGRLAVEQLDLASELGEAKLRSTLNVQELSGLLAGDWLAPRTATVEADLDLTRLARAVPGVVRLRPGTAIQSGRARLTLASQPLGDARRPGGRALNASLDTSDLTAVAGGRVVQWNRPLVLRGTGTHDAGGLRINEFVCQSEFLDATGRMIGGAGALPGVDATLKFDLDRLTQQLGRFVDLTGWRLAGRGQAKVRIERPADGRFATVANVDLTDVAVATPERVLVNEQRLVGNVSASGLHNASLRPTRLDRIDGQISAGGDTLTITTTGPIAADGSTPIKAGLSGALGDWLERLRLVSPGAAAGVQRLVGNAEVSAEGVVAPGRYALSDFRFKATDFLLDAGELRIREPQVTINGAATLDQNAGRLTSNRLWLQTMAASASLARGETLNVAWGTTAQQAPSSGRLDLVADLERLAGWFAPLRRGDAILPRGQVRGAVTLADQNGRVTANLNLQGQQLALSQRAAGATSPTVLWQTATMTVRGEAAYAANIDQLTFRNLAVESPSLRGAATGVVNRLQGDAETQINGTVDYDLQQWAPVIAARMGPGFQIAGRDQARFQLSGKLAATDNTPWSQRLSARVEAPWASAVAYGVPIGPGRLGLALSQGVVRADPLVVALGAASPAGAPSNESGRLTVQPAVRIDPAPIELGLPAGPVLTNVRITPEISEEMLKYVAPVLQGATRSEGLFSLTTNGVRAPLADLKQMQATGQLAVQSVRVVPGPMTEQWVGLAQQIEAITNGDPTALLSGSTAAPRQTTLLSIEDRTVEYQVANGRVYHQAMPFRVGNVVMLSSGSVGFDETLDLTIAVPIQDRWVEGKPLLVSLRGQSLQIPVRGTFDRPQVDRSAIRNLSRQLGRDAIRGAVGNEIGRFLDRALGN